MQIVHVGRAKNSIAVGNDPKQKAERRCLPESPILRQAMKSRKAVKSGRREVEKNRERFDWPTDSVCNMADADDHWKQWPQS